MGSLIYTKANAWQNLQNWCNNTILEDEFPHAYEFLLSPGGEINLSNLHKQNLQKDNLVEKQNILVKQNSIEKLLMEANYENQRQKAITHNIIKLFLINLYLKHSKHQKRKNDELSLELIEKIKKEMQKNITAKDEVDYKDYLKEYEKLITETEKNIANLKAKESHLIAEAAKLENYIDINESLDNIHTQLNDLDTQQSDIGKLAELGDNLSKNLNSFAKLNNFLTIPEDLKKTIKDLELRLDEIKLRPLFLTPEDNPLVNQAHLRPEFFNLLRNNVIVFQKSFWDHYGNIEQISSTLSRTRDAIKENNTEMLEQKRRLSFFNEQKASLENLMKADPDLSNESYKSSLAPNPFSMKLKPY